MCRTCSPSSTLVCCCAAARDSPLAVICLRSRDTRRVAAIRGRQCRRHNVRRRGFAFDTWFISSTYWDWPTVEQRGCVVDWCGRSLALGGLYWWLGEVEVGGGGVVNLDIWPPIVQQVWGQLVQTGLSGLAVPLQTPHPSAEFLLITQRKMSSPRCPAARLFTDACRVTLIPPLWRPSIFKGASVGDLWVAILCALGLLVHPEMDLMQCFCGIFPQITAIWYKAQWPGGDGVGWGEAELNQADTRMTRAADLGRRHQVWNLIGWWRRKDDTVSQLAYEYNRWHRHKAQLHTYLCCMSPKVEYKITLGGELIMRHAIISVIGWNEQEFDESRGNDGRPGW